MAFAGKVTDTNNIFTKYCKPFVQKLMYKSGNRHVLMIFGAQRSGTTLLSRTFDSFLSVKSFGEFSSLSNECPLKIRLNDINKVNKALSKECAPLIVMKPLVESQHAAFLLKSIPKSYGIWMYRHYLDVASSGVKHFKNTKGKGNLLPIVKNELGNWRNENISKEVREKVLKLYNDNLSAHECACLFWYVRNSLYFSENLYKLNNVFLWNYEELMNQPRSHFNNLGRELQLDFSKFKYEKVYSNNSVVQVNDFKVNNEILDLCDGMWEKLNSQHGK
jgi:hypothetical protein